MRYNVKFNDSLFQTLPVFPGFMILNSENLHEHKHMIKQWQNLKTINYIQVYQIYTWDNTGFCFSNRSYLKYLTFALQQVAEAADVATLEQADCLEVLSECGLTEILTVS